MSVWLTPQAADRLRTELAALTSLADAARDHAEAGDGTGDHALAGAGARERTARIRHIQDLLEDAVIGEDPPDDGVAEPGMVLTVRYDDTGDVETFLLGIRGAEDGDIAVYSPDSPLGTALDGARPGDQRTYRVPSGTLLPVTLLQAVPYGRYRSTGLPR